MKFVVGQSKFCSDPRLGSRWTTFPPRSPNRGSNWDLCSVRWEGGKCRYRFCKRGVVRCSSKRAFVTPSSKWISGENNREWTYVHVARMATCVRFRGDESWSNSSPAIIHVGPLANTCLSSIRMRPYIRPSMHTHMYNICANIRALRVGDTRMQILMIGPQWTRNT